MKYTAESVRAEITPDFREACIARARQEASALGLLGDTLVEVEVAGEWYNEKLRALGVDEWSREKMAFSFGRACCFRDPYEVAAMALNLFVEHLPPEGLVADNESVYDERISPLMKQIIAICKEHGIPMVAAFQFSEEGVCHTALLKTPGAHVGLLAASRIILNRGELPGPRQRPDRAVVFAETHRTMPDGSKHVTIRTVR